MPTLIMPNFCSTHKDDHANFGSNIRINLIRYGYQPVYSTMITAHPSVEFADRRASDIDGLYPVWWMLINVLTAETM